MLYAWIMMIAVLQSSGDYATFSETFGSKAACEAKIVEAKQLDLKSNDAHAEIVYAACIQVKARNPIGLNPAPGS